MYYGCFAKTVFLEDLVVRALSAAGMLLGYIVCTRVEGPGPGGLIRTYVYIYTPARVWRGPLIDGPIHIQFYNNLQLTPYHSCKYNLMKHKHNICMYRTKIIPYMHNSIWPIL